MTTTPPEPPGGTPGYGTPPPAPGFDPNAGGYGQPPMYGGAGGGVPSAPGQWAGPPLAEWPARVGATLIDSLIISVPYLILSQISVALAYLVYLGLWLYLLYMQGTTGQTVGKKVLKIKLLREADGQPVGVGLSIGRAFVHIVDALPCLLGYLWPLWDAKKQTFADKILQTVVVKA